MMKSSTNNFYPFQYTENPSTSIQEDNSSHFLFPPFHDDGDLLLNELLVLQQHQVLVSNTNLAADTPQEEIPTATKKSTAQNNKKKGNERKAASTKQTVARKRSGKKDRHSKIYTAQGPRDRRMRLSLRIARKFFDLQDMLGFDKASKTIDWLFTKSKAAIKELAETLPKVKRCDSFSSTSESEVMSGSKTIIPLGNNGDNKEVVLTEESSVLRLRRRAKSTKPAFNAESREKARARARERTKEKLKIRTKQENPNNLGFTAGKEEEEEEQGHCSNFSLQPQMDSVIGVDKFLGLTNSQKSSSIFDLSVILNGADFENEFSRFPGNWDISDGNPNSIFSNSQEQNLTSAFMVSPTLNIQEGNPNSVFVNKQNPNQETMALHSHHNFIEDQFFCNP